MCGDQMGFGRRSEGAGSAETLQLIAAALGVPLASFYGERGLAADDLAGTEADYLLSLVRTHFARVPAEDRRAFAEAVQRLTAEG